NQGKLAACGSSRKLLDDTLQNIKIPQMFANAKYPGIFRGWRPGRRRSEERGVYSMRHELHLRARQHAPEKLRLVPGHGYDLVEPRPVRPRPTRPLYLRRRLVNGANHAVLRQCR